MQWFFDRAGSTGGLRRTLPAMLPSGQVNGVGTPNSLISRLNSPACTYPFQRFASVLTDVDAWFGATVVRYSFDVGLFHSFLHAGLSRRSNCSGRSDSRHEELALE
jgi:hypothetical protein